MQRGTEITEQEMNAGEARMKGDYDVRMERPVHVFVYTGTQ